MEKRKLKKKSENWNGSFKVSTETHTEEFPSRNRTGITDDQLNTQKSENLESFPDENREESISTDLNRTSHEVFPGSPELSANKKPESQLSEKTFTHKLSHKSFEKNNFDTYVSDSSIKQEVNEPKSKKINTFRRKPSRRDFIIGYQDSEEGSKFPLTAVAPEIDKGENSLASGNSVESTVSSETLDSVKQEMIFADPLDPYCEKSQFEEGSSVYGVEAVYSSDDKTSIPHFSMSINKSPKKFRKKCAAVSKRSRKTSNKPVANEEYISSSNSEVKPTKSYPDSEFKCIVCGEVYLSKNLLTRHMSTHEYYGPYKCDLCERLFDERKALEKHKTGHRNQDRFVCIFCGKKFSFNDRLTRHLRIHSGEKNYDCTSCEKKFSTSELLRKHNMIHSGEKPFMCDICGQTFSMKYNLASHIRVHTGDKPFKCDFCDQSFNQLTPCKRHMRIHTGEKPFKCEICERAFADRGALRQHGRTHSGEKPYVCEVCSKAFMNAYKLRIHMKIHGDKPDKPAN